MSASTVKAWTEAVRLRTLPVSVAGVVTAIGYSILHDNLNLLPACICMVFALLCQVASNFANEYYDYRAGRDRVGREGPRRGVTEGDISPRAMLTAVLVTIAVACGVGLSLVAWGGWWLIAVGAAVAVGVFAYSAGPFPLSTNGLGEVAVLIFFGIVPVTLTYYVQTREWNIDVLLGGISMGLMGANVLIVNNYRDIDDDRAVGKRTLAVRLGRRAMQVLYIANATVAMALMLPEWWQIGFAAVPVPVLTLTVAVAIAINLGRREGAALTPLLAKTSALMCVYALLFLLCVSYLG